MSRVALATMANLPVTKKNFICQLNVRWWAVNNNNRRMSRGALAPKANTPVM